MNKYFSIELVNQSMPKFLAKCGSRTISRAKHQQTGNDQSRRYF